MPFVKFLVIAALTSAVMAPVRSHAVDGDAVGGFGFNLDEKLLNPGEANVSSDQLRRQIARLTYDARMTGARTLRWMPTDIWPQWRCANDPEDADGAIDPEWREVVAALLQQAQRDGLRVVVTLADATNGGFAGLSSADRNSKLASWAAHRAAVRGSDRYPAAAHDCSKLPPYFSRSEADLFTDPQLTDRLTKRFVTMAQYLAKFPALGAIELFNEPDFQLTQTPEYWTAVAAMLRAVKNAEPALAGVPVFSGTAAWNPKIVAQAKAAGAFDLEPFITVHAYDDYTQPEAKVAARLNALVDFLRRIAPGKPIIIAEAGSKTSLTQLSDNAKMVRVLLNVYATRQVGLWVWGDFFPQPVNADFKWDFNHRSPAGASLAPYFFDANETAKYSAAQQVQASTPAGATEPLAIKTELVNDRDPWKNGLWAIELNSERFLGFSRAGIFARQSGGPGMFTSPPPTYFVSEGPAPLRWAQIERSNSGWRLRVFHCAAGSASGAATPDALLGLMEDTKRADVSRCNHSSELYEAAF